MSPTTPYGPLIESRVRVVTWNLWWRLGDWERRASAIAETLEELCPDLVCLQEVWQEGNDNQAALLAERLGMTSAFARDRTEDGVDQGVALLSRWPLADVDSRALPVPSDVRDANVALRAVVEGPRGPLLLAMTHLIPYPHRSEWREQQIRALVDFVAATHTRATDHHGRSIVAGDFNAPQAWTWSSIARTNLLGALGRKGAPGLEVKLLGEMYRRATAWVYAGGRQQPVLQTKS